jgi:starch synthase
VGNKILLNLTALKIIPMEILHVSAECYPVAKAGGLADVVGALPKYQNEFGHIAKVVTLMHRTKFLYEHEFDVVHKGSFGMGMYWFNYTIIKEKINSLGFDLYLVDINGLLDRERIYGYDDDIERFTAFQIAVVDWVSKWEHAPDVMHVHDHHTALIPFMMQHCYAYQKLSGIKTILTIHNAQYQGWMGWDKSVYIPEWDSWKSGLLEWENTINSLASGIKCASKVTTVSNSYLDELRVSANGLEKLFEYERGKCVGILNGIDDDVWDPATDSYLHANYGVSDAAAGKLKNKQKLCKQFNLDVKKPLIIFIGRLVNDKSADLLPGVIGDALYHLKAGMNFLVLGSGDPHIEWELGNMSYQYVGYYNSRIGYNEQLSHQMYAGADFLLMPSRVEPCGLNQFYAMRYGTIPIVRNTGGLKDSVIDIGDTGGYGIKFYNADVGDITNAIYRGIKLYENASLLKDTRDTLMLLDNSWEKSTGMYLELYKQ